MKQVLAICISDVCYGERFSKYLICESRNAFQILYFTGTEQLESYLFDHVADLLLLEEGMSITKEALANGKRQCYLTEEPSQRQDYIYKYQSMEMIMQQLYEGMDLFQTGQEEQSTKSSMKIISFLSLLPGEVDTDQTYSYALQRARQESTLYLNFSQFENLIYQSNLLSNKNLSDFLYYLKQSNKNLVQKFNRAIQTNGGMDYINAVDHAMDLYELGESESKQLLECLKEVAKYQCVILHYEVLTEGVIYLLSQSDEIYVILRNGSMCERRKSIFIHQMEQLLGSDLVQQFHWISEVDHMG